MTFIITNKINYIKEIISSNNLGLIHKNIGTIFGFDDNGLPNEANGQVLYCAQQELRRISKDLEQELMFERFYRDSASRYTKYAACNMIKINPTKFYMGTLDSGKKYLGEEPQHSVQLNSFEIGKTVVTEEIYHYYDQSYCMSGEPNMPVVNISWYDAAMFAVWVNCRLLTEAEWEYACRGNTLTDWCCEAERELELYAWYSNSSDGYVHQVGLLKPNKFGLHDMHGNVWEWCMDGYENDYYSKSPKLNPINNKEKLNKVCRGGSMHAFSEMCRSAFRHNEPPDYKATDVGFRLAKA